MTRAVPGSPGRPLGRRRRRVVITGTGAVGPFGAGTGALLEGIVAGRSPLERIDGCCCAPVRDPLAAGPFPPNAWRRLDRASRMAVLASAEALAEAGHDPASPDRAALPEGGVVLGTMTAGTGPLHGFLSTLFTQGPEAVSPMDFPFTVHNAPAGQCAILLGLKGPNLTTCRMEASGLAAIALAADLVRGGAADAVLAGGVDERVPIVTEAWRRWRVVSRGAPESYRGPFDRGRRGFAPGEGAYCVVLEESERARARGARPWAEIRAAATAHAPSEPHRWPDDPAAPARAIAGALAEAELGTKDLGYIVASANGSPRLDRLEARALREALGPAARRVPISGLKGAVGESGASSACGAVVAALSIRDGFIPPVARLVDPEPDLGLDLVLGGPRRGPVPAVLVHALGAGGSCVALILSRFRP